MTASLVFERGASGAFNGEEEELVAGALVRSGGSASFSMPAGAEFDVGDCKVSYKETGVFAAFSGSYFDIYLVGGHGGNPFMIGKSI
jgi:hypothetical protein